LKIASIPDRLEGKLIMPTDEQRMAKIKAVQEKYAAELINKPHVVGVSVGRANDGSGELALVVLVDRDVPNDQREPRNRIPEVLDGVPVITRKVGTISAQ
jgi:hypothetical protein